MRSEKAYPLSIKITVLTFQANQKYNGSFRGAVYFLRIREKTLSEIQQSQSFSSLRSLLPIVGVSMRGERGEGEEVFLRKHNHQFVVLEIQKVNVSHAQRTRFSYPSRTISKIADRHPLVFIRTVTFLFPQAQDQSKWMLSLRHKIFDRSHGLLSTISSAMKK